MSEWAEFCEDMGVDPGSPDDYDRLIGHISGKSLPRRKRRDSDDGYYAPADKLQLERQALRFETREQAERWSRSNNGRKFVQSIHGPHFVPENGMDAPAQNGLFVEVGVTLWPPKPYPKTNPRASTWIPGTYPTTANESELYKIDEENDRRRFFPLLKKLSPFIYSAKLDGGIQALPKSMCSVYGQKMTERQMYQLLSLAQDRLERSQQYYRTEAEAHRRPVEQREEPDHEGYIWFGDEGVLKEDPFWRTVYDAVMDELIDLI